jgi:hypothetical protein
MATRSTIAVQYPDNTIKQIYCHWDGYIEHNGRILKQYYSTPELAQELISHGDLSVLGDYINPVGTHTFDKPEENCCVYYGRDRGEYNTAARVFNNWTIFTQKRSAEEYDYFYSAEHNRWYLLNTRTECIEYLTDPTELDPDQLDPTEELIETDIEPEIKDLTFAEVTALLGYKFRLVG